MTKTVSSLALIGSLSISGFSAEFISIGTGGVVGTYYPAGGAICRMVNKRTKETNLRCSVESTGGSVYNINTIRAGELDFGIAQSDVIHYALEGQKKFKGKPFPKLRSVMAIYPELLAFVVSKKSGIKSLEDMKGKRINIDVPGSGTRLTVEILMGLEGVKDSDLKLKSELGSPECPNLLKDNKIDGYFGMFGHPTANIKDAANSREPIDLVAISGKKIDKLVKDYPYYSKGDIAGGLYRGIEHKTPTIGVKAILATSSDVSEKAAYTVAKAVVENFDAFKAMHPSFANITKQDLVTGVVAPLHEGAKKYYKEIGLIK